MSAQLVDSEIWSSESTDLEGIAKALHRLRTHIRTDDDPGAPPEVTEAAVLNLVVAASEEALLDEAADVIARLAQRHPSRSILFLRAPGRDDGLAAHVHAFCTVSPGTARQVCCEQLRIDGRGGYAGQLHSIIPPLIVPDVPVFAWWRGAPPFRTTTYERLRRMSQRMIVDSSGFREAFGQLSAEVLRCATEGCAISDLAWGRLEGWREHVARLFDPSDTAAYLSQIRAIRITTTVAVYPTEAVLLLSWLASRLDWQPSGPLEPAPDGWRCHFTLPGRSIDCRVTQAAGDATPGAEPIRAVSIDADTKEFELTADPRGEFVSQKVVVDGRLASEAHTGMRRPDLFTLLSQELEMLQNDLVYESAVALGAQLSAS
jgi:glucose-6-phosphate dehydrogenase assembly protein OpcA